MFKGVQCLNGSFQLLGTSDPSGYSWARWVLAGAVPPGLPLGPFMGSPGASLLTSLHHRAAASPRCLEQHRVMLPHLVALLPRLVAPLPRLVALLALRHSHRWSPQPQMKALGLQAAPCQQLTVLTGVLPCSPTSGEVLASGRGVPRYNLSSSPSPHPRSLDKLQNNYRGVSAERTSLEIARLENKSDILPERSAFPADAGAPICAPEHGPGALPGVDRCGDSSVLIEVIFLRWVSAPHESKPVSEKLKME